MLRAEWWENLTYRKLAQIGCAVFFLIFVCSLIGWVLQWAILPMRVVNPQEGLQRWRWFYDTKDGLEALSSNIETAHTAVVRYEDQNGDTDKWDWQQRQSYDRLLSVERGYINGYNTLAGQYNAKMDDMTRSWSAPPDLPRYIKPYNASSE